MSNKITEYKLIDILKFVFSLSVVVVHFVLYPLGSFVYNNELYCFFKNTFSRMAVPFFFACTGFFLFNDTKNVEGQVVKKYIYKLLKLYAIWNLISFISNNVQMWYIRAVIESVIIVYFLLKKGVSINSLLIISSLLYAIGLLGDSYYGLINPLTNYSIFSLLLNKYENIFITTRNGIFMGPIFVVIGIYVRNHKINNKRKPILFCFSSILLILEYCILKNMNISKDFNMFIMSPIATYYLLSLVSSIEIRTKKSFVLLRQMSTIIFFSHTLIIQVISMFMSFTNKMFEIEYRNGTILFIMTLLICVVFSYIIVMLSKKRKFDLIKDLYI